MEIIMAKVHDNEKALSIVRACAIRMAIQGIDQWDEIYPNKEIIDQDIAKGTLFLAFDRTLCKGIIVLNSTQSKQYDDVNWLYRDGKILVVHRLAVAPEVHRSGTASYLMDFAEGFGRKNGYSAIRLDAFVRNQAAVELYQRRQYRLAGTVEFRKGPFHCFEKSCSGSPADTVYGSPNNYNR